MLDMRDNVLVQAQSQLDALAGGDGAARCPIETIDGHRAYRPARRAGFDVDTAGLLRRQSASI